MEQTGGWSRVALDAGPFFRFGSTGYLLELLRYLGSKAAISREVETELERNGRKTEYAFLKAVEVVAPPLEVIDLGPASAEELLDRVRAVLEPGEHPDTHKGEISTVLLAVEIGDALVICDDALGKRLAKHKQVPRLSTVQLAAEMVVAGELPHEAGAAIFVASAGGADPEHFNNAVKLATKALKG